METDKRPMLTTHAIMRERLLQRAGLTALPAPPFAGVTFAQLRRSEWSEGFENLMRNRLVMGALRYGTIDAGRKLKKAWDRTGAMLGKVEQYRKTGNTEYLVDIANYCLLEFELGLHPHKHFHALDDHHDHCKQIIRKHAADL
jgi:hypothetical protein